MREQTLQTRVGRSAPDKWRAAVGTQRPTRRQRGGAQAGAESRRLRRALGYAPLVAKCLLAAGAGVLLFMGYRAAASASLFQLRNVDTSGLARVSPDEIKRIVRAAARDGVWHADLNAISAELERQTWVRKAVVTRVLPDGLRVRIVERQPRAVVRTSSGRLVWVDEDAVMLGAVAPEDHLPAFFIRGWDEENTASARAENRERLQKYFEMEREWRAENLSERVSEVNLLDLRDVRAQLAGEDARIEVRLGKGGFGKRLKQALEKLDEHRRAGRESAIIYLDATQDNRIIIGLNTGAVSDAAPDTAPRLRSGAGTSRREEQAGRRAQKRGEVETQRRGDARARRTAFYPRAHASPHLRAAMGGADLNG